MSRCPVPETCPMIDEVISEIDDAVSLLANLENKLEKIRAANAQLRAWGYEEYHRAEEAESELEVAQSELADLTRQLDEANSEESEV